METSCMKEHPQTGFMFDKLGISIISIVSRDIFLLENQIPLWIVKLLLRSRDKENQLGEELLDRYMTTSLFGDFRGKRNLPRGYPEELHLLEAFHRLLAFGFVRETKNTCLSFINRKFFCCFEAKEQTDLDSNIDLESGESSQFKSGFPSCMNYLTARAWRKLFKNARSEGDYAKGHLRGFINSFCSVTDLKAAGIYFKPNQTLSLKDVKFESNCIFGKLQLPVWCVSTHTKIFFMNMIAYELSQNNPSTQAIMTSYINLMKSLIARVEDVKELREKKILCDMLGNDEEILEVYRDINTPGADNSSIFYEIRCKIQAHCNRKATRWIAELANTYFRSPWTFIAFLATIYLLILTTLQTIYTINPK